MFVMRIWFWVCEVLVLGFGLRIWFDNIYKEFVLCFWVLP